MHLTMRTCNHKHEKLISYLRVVLSIIFLMIATLFMSSSGMGYARETLNEGFVEPHLLEILTAEFAADPYSKKNYDPFIKLRVYNASSERVTRAFLKCKLVADGREVLSTRLVKIPAQYLKPYSATTWLIYPKAASAWGLQRIPPDAELQVEVEKVFCPKRNSPWQPEYNFRIPRRRDFL